MSQEEVQRVTESLDALDAIEDRGERIRAKSRVMAAQIERNKDWADERRTYVNELKAAGMTYRAIAEEVGTSIATVQSILSGYKGSGLHRPRKEKPAE